jgi:hypothetical protein
MRNDSIEIIEVIWMSGVSNPCTGLGIGIVLAKNTKTGMQCAYIGISSTGRTEKQDVQDILDWGAPLSCLVAEAFFPDIPFREQKDLIYDYSREALMDWNDPMGRCNGNT